MKKFLSAFTLANGASHGVVSDSNRKIAFTLAEVLITLGIIGVVAALTVPTLIAKYKEKENSAKLKKVYSTLSQAMLSVVNEHGTIDTWDLSTSNGGTNDDGQTIIDSRSMDILADRFGKYLKHTRLDADWGEDIVETNMQRVPLEKKYDKNS